MIELHNISLKLGARSIFNNASFRFESDSVYFVQGASGVGKTTLLNLCAGYVKPDSGVVSHDGEIEYLFQTELLFSELTVTQNLMIRVVANQDRACVQDVDAVAQVEHVLEQVGLPHLAQSMVRDLSGGERRRVEIAGALIGSPSVLLLDEPVGSLDPDNAISVYDSLWRVREGRTIIIVTHEPNLLNAPADAVILRLQAEGNLSALTEVV